MAKCVVCEKSLVFGNNVSHSHRKSGRTWCPNIRKVRTNQNGATKTIHICSRCLRTAKKNGQFERAVKSSAQIVAE